MRDQGRQILHSPAEWRKLDGKDIQPEEQVLAECTCANRICEMAIGCGHYPGVYSGGSFRSYAVQLTRLQRAKQLGLGFLAQVTYFIQKEGSAVSQLEPA
jgi:hypothetical protein